MSQQALVEKINKHSANEVAEVKAVQEAEIKKIGQETDSAIAKLKDTHDLTLSKKKAQQELVAISRARQAGNIALQGAKRDGLNEILNTALQNLTDLPSADYVAFFTQKGETILPKDVKVINVLAPKKRQDETVEILKKLGLSPNVKADDTIKAGFIVEAEDGVYDVTLERIFSEKMAVLEMRIIAKALA